MTTAAPSIPAKAASTRLTSRWAGEAPIYIIGLALMSLCIALLLNKGVPVSLGGLFSSGRIFFIFAVIFAFFDTVWSLIQHRPDSPIAFYKARYSAPKLWSSILAGLPFIAVATIILPFFSEMKSAIPLFNDYTWDETFIQWDRALFFGYDAWQVLQPALGYPIVSASLAFLYHLWFLLLYPGVMYFAFARMDNDVRRQFFLSYLLSWSLIGGGLATWLASVGPCFLEPMTGNAHFNAQMAYLYAANEDIPIMVLPVQEMLLEWHETSQNGLGSGITAMPSMHCAIAFLYWLAVRRLHRGWGAAFGVFALIIWISSVHLAYHYAVDGLVSLAAIAAIWALSERIIWFWDRWLAVRSASLTQPHAALRTKTAPAE
ncbi:MAG: phosphatase PAP2 family protein [Pseudomonadota bacterium]